MGLVLTTKFFGEDTILILDFFAEYVQGAYVLRMREAYAYIALPYVLSGVTEDQFNSVRGISRASGGGVNCWPEGIKYLLRSCTTNDVIQDAILALRDTKKKSDETEIVYSNQFNKALHRFGNVYSTQ